jgi:hypothetical protein
MALSIEPLASILDQHNMHLNPLELLWVAESQPVYGMRVPGATASQTWHQLKQLVEQTHYYPVLFGDEDSVARHREDAEETSTYLILGNGLVLDAEQWFHQKNQERQEDWGNDAEIDQSILDDLTGAELGVWRDDLEPINTFTIPNDILSQRPLDEIILAFVPTMFSWEVPAFLGFGNWNGCPEAEAQVALMKRWHQLYKAEVVGITSDVVEMWVEDPPRDRGSAFQLAQEHYTYCNDIVEQGVETLNNLAAILLNASVWFFWWD